MYESHSADICAASSSNQIYIGISYIETFDTHRANIDGSALAAPKSAREGSKVNCHLKDSGFVAWVPAVVSDRSFVVDTIKILPTEKSLTLMCNPFTYSLEAKQWIRRNDVE